MSAERPDPELTEACAGLPLLSATRREWAGLAAMDLPVFLADHAVCEQQAALYALNLVAHYPDDQELVRCLTALAAEELSHLRRVVRLLHARGLAPARRRASPYVSALHARIRRDREPQSKIDRLLVGALIEARSCERFTCLLEQVRGTDAALAALLHDLGPAERRHWEMFHGLAARAASRPALDACWRDWLEYESELARGLGTAPTVHG